jgi:thiamine biosynthesis lipoprotein
MPRAASLFLIAAACLEAARPALAGPPPARVEASRMSMGCLYTIVAYGPDPGVVSTATERALDEVDRLDRLMSHFRPDSPLSQLNQQPPGTPAVVDSELFDLIAVADTYSRESDGAFDITVGPLMKAWGFFRGLGRVPGGDELSQLRRRVGYRHVVLDRARRSIAFDLAGVEIDLGAIAKGYAVDRAVATLRQHGVTAALVSAGGSTIYALGAPPESDGWPIDVQDPLAAGRVAFTLTLRDRALSVAGRSEKSFEIDGVEYTHILDPRTGMPVRGVLGVVVLAPDGTSGDALDTTLFVQGPAAARMLLAAHEGSEAFFLMPAPKGKWTSVRVGGASGR